jgi:septal ring factor EnvC (AmiA/AmiB activator)
MKANLLIAILSALLACAANPCAAQQASDPQRKEQLQQRLQQVKDRLNLTPEQAEQVRPILTEEVESLRALREKYNGSGQDRRTRMKMGRELRSIRSTADDKLKKVLSKQQMDEWKKIREEWRQDLRERAGRK